jgi:D-alanyl-D-alanine dipeptidase
LKVCPNLVIDIEQSRRPTEKTLLLRRSVAQMLCQAQQLLPQGYTFVINDAWRSKLVQQRYFQNFVQRFKHEHPNWSQNRIEKEAGRFAIPPDDEKRAGHLTGAAVDLELWHSGRRAPQKSLKIPFSEAILATQTDMPEYIIKNRKILSGAMTRAGFTNYPNEYWHWSYGDVMWAELNGKNTAIYGAVEK